MLDQIRANGEKKELVDEVVTLAKRYGITTPYTSYLVVPDGPLPIGRPMPASAWRRRARPFGLARATAAAVRKKVAEFARRFTQGEGKDGAGAARGKLEDEQTCKELARRSRQGRSCPRTPLRRPSKKAQDAIARSTTLAQKALAGRDLDRVQAGRTGRRSVGAVQQPAQPELRDPHRLQGRAEPQLPGSRRRLDRRRLQSQDADRHRQGHERRPTSASWRSIPRCAKSSSSATTWSGSPPAAPP